MDGENYRGKNRYDSYKKKHIRATNKPLEEMRKELQELKTNIAKTIEEEEQEAAEEVKRAIISGVLDIRDVLDDIDIVSLAESTHSKTKPKKLLKTLSIPAIMRIKSSLLSFDERIALSAAKIVIDADTSEPETDCKPVNKIIREIIDPSNSQNK